MLPQLRAALGQAQLPRDVAAVEPLAGRAQRRQALGRADGLRFVEQRLALRRGLLGGTKTLDCFHASTTRGKRRLVARALLSGGGPKLPLIPAVLQLQKGAISPRSWAPGFHQTMNTTLGIRLLGNTLLAGWLGLAGCSQVAAPSTKQAESDSLLDPVVNRLYLDIKIGRAHV